MTKYKTSSWRLDIQEVEILKESEHFVFIDHKDCASSYREAKRSDSGGYYDTFEEAKAALIETKERKVESYRNGLQHYEMELEKVRSLTAPVGS